MRIIRPIRYTKAIVPITDCLNDDSVNVRLKYAEILGNFKSNDLIIKYIDKFVER